MMSGISRDFVIEMHIPKTPVRIGDEQKNHEILDVKISAFDLRNS
jgi:hypothetical protein